MIAWGDVYKVAAAMAPLYFALGLGYGSVRWWRLFTPEQCAAVNTLVAHFSMPFFTFDFLARADPYAMDRRVLAADAASKAVAAAAVACWWWWARCCCRCGGDGGANKQAGAGAGARSAWCVTGFSLAAYNNTLVVGAPLLDAMYGAWARDLIVQIAVVQALVWFPILLLGFELRKAWVVGDGGITIAAGDGQAAGGAGRVKPAAVSSLQAQTASSPPPAAEKGDDVEMNAAAETPAGMIRRLWPTVRTVALKLAGNPNVYASVLGVAWACIAFRWGLRLPGVVTGSLQVMSRTGTGLSMFSMGLFMAQQERMVACGAGLAALGMSLRFVAGPLATLAGAAAFGLRGDVLRFAIIQAALPQSISSFVFAKEYGVHADVLSTAVIFGTLVSLPVLIAYYALLGVVS